MNVTGQKNNFQFQCADDDLEKRNAVISIKRKTTKNNMNKKVIAENDKVMLTFPQGDLVSKS